MSGQLYLLLPLTWAVGYAVCGVILKRALDGGHAAWGWQTFAWSGGKGAEATGLRGGGSLTGGGARFPE